jgi:hypothetical protein
MNAPAEATRGVTLSWISMMGYDQLIMADIDRTARRVLVNDATLDLMAWSIVDCGIMSEEDDASFAAEIRATPADEYGMHDVTEVGGGWQTWLDRMPDAD